MSNSCGNAEHRPTSVPASVDALSSAEVARRIESLSIRRANLSARNLICLGLLGGLYIGLGGAWATLVLTAD
jgi:hypothetical protein